MEILVWECDWNDKFVREVFIQKIVVVLKKWVVEIVFQEDLTSILAISISYVHSRWISYGNDIALE